MKEEQDQGHNVEADPEVQESSVEATPSGKGGAPDGGWGWMCVLGSAIGHVVFGIIIRAFGVTYLALLERFGSSATATAWVGAINFAGTGFLGPVVSALCRRYDCRRVTMAGGIFVAVGVIATGYAPNIYVTFVTFGAITGIGLGLAYTPGYLIIGQYFEKRKALAMSIASFSSGIGALAAPPLLVLLLREYGFAGMFLVIGAICLNVCVGGALYRPLQTTKPPEKLRIVETDPQNSPVVEAAKESDKEPTVADTFISEDTYVLPNDIEVFVHGQSMDHISVSETLDKQDEVETDTKKDSLRARYLRLFKIPAFIALAFIVFSLSYALGLISGFLPALAVDNGIPEEKAAWLLSISGICSMVCTLGLGPLLDVPAIRRYRLHIYNAGNLVCGVCTLLFAAVGSFRAYAAIVVGLSSWAGVLMAQRATVVGDIVGRASDAEGFGVVLMTGAVGSLLGRSLAGSIKDMWGQYNFAFYVSGSLGILSSVIFEITLIRQEVLQDRREKSQT